VVGATPGDSYMTRDPDAVTVVRAIRQLVRGASATFGALSVGPEVEEEEEGWMSAWLASGLFDGGMQDVPCSAMGPDEAWLRERRVHGIAAQAEIDAMRGVNAPLASRMSSAMDEANARRQADAVQGSSMWGVLFSGAI